MKDINTIERKVKYEGELDLMGFKIPCYVLEDGTRVLSGRGMQSVLKIYEVEEGKEKAGSRLKEFLSQKSLQPFIYKEEKPEEKLNDIFNPIICHKGGTTIHGYEATLLPEMCSVFLKVRKETREKGKGLSTRWKEITDWAEVLLGILAKVSIIALVDEATGYQYEREKNELQVILKAYVSEEVLKWQETFHIDFYKQIFRLWSIPFTARSIKKKPQFIGYLTNKLVYENLPKGSFILSELKAKTPRTKGGHPKHKLHQSLTPEVGREALKKVIYTVETLASISKDKNRFLKLVKEKYHPEKDLPYIDVEAMDDNKKETEVDKALKVLLKTPKPKKDK